jgi:hypothetical protein
LEQKEAAAEKALHGYEEAASAAKKESKKDVGHTKVAQKNADKAEAAIANFNEGSEDPNLFLLESDGQRQTQR